MKKILGLTYFDFFSALKHIVWACHPRTDIASFQHFNSTAIPTTFEKSKNLKHVITVPIHFSSIYFQAYF